MPKRSRSEDANETAHRTVNAVILRHDPDAAPPKPKKKNAAAVELGRRGGLKGGHARAAKLTPEERRASARKAALARWERKA